MSQLDEDRAKSLEEHAREWDKLAAEVPAHLPHKRQTFERTATAFRMQAVDGQWRCSCHLLTPAQWERTTHR